MCFARSTFLFFFLCFWMLIGVLVNAFLFVINFNLRSVEYKIRVELYVGIMTLTVLSLGNL